MPKITSSISTSSEEFRANAVASAGAGRRPRGEAGRGGGGWAGEAQRAACVPRQTAAARTRGAAGRSGLAFLELSALAALGMYSKDPAPASSPASAACSGREVVIVCNDATVKGGAY